MLSSSGGVIEALILWTAAWLTDRRVAIVSMRRDFFLFLGQKGKYRQGIAKVSNNRPKFKPNLAQSLTCAER